VTTKGNGTMARINAALRKAGRAEQLVRGHGYYYLHGGTAANLPQSGIYGGTTFTNTEREFVYTAYEVEGLYRQGGIEVVLLHHPECEQAVAPGDTEVTCNCAHLRAAAPRA